MGKSRFKQTGEVCLFYTNSLNLLIDLLLFLFIYFYFTNICTLTIKKLLSMCVQYKKKRLYIKKEYIKGVKKFIIY